MSDALEALGAIEQLIRWHLCEQEGMSSGQPTPEEWENAVDAAADAVTTIRAALEQAEPVADVYESHDDDYQPVRARLNERGQQLPPGTKLYAAPPSTAEAQAMALEDAAYLFQMCYQPGVASELREMAKRRRSEMP